MYHTHELEDSLLWRHQFSPFWSIDPAKHKSEFQLVFFVKIGKLILLCEKAKEVEQPK